MVTGANSGIGYELTKKLLFEGFDVVALVRSPVPVADQFIHEALTTKQLRVYQADFGDWRSLKEGLSTIKANESSIDVLFNNAGVAPQTLQSTARGWDLTFDINTLAPYIVTREILPLVEAGVLKAVVNTSSNALLFVREFTLSVLEHPITFAPFSGPYGRSKLALSLWTSEWAAELNRKGIKILSVNPGPNSTKMNNPNSENSTTPWFIRLVQKIINTPPLVGASHLYEAAFGESPKDSGSFLNSRKQRKLPFASLAHDVLLRVENLYQSAYLSA